MSSQSAVLQHSLSFHHPSQPTCADTYLPRAGSDESTSLVAVVVVSSRVVLLCRTNAHTNSFRPSSFASLLFLDSFPLHYASGVRGGMGMGVWVGAGCLRARARGAAGAGCGRGRRRMHTSSCPAQPDATWLSRERDTGDARWTSISSGDIFCMLVVGRR